MRKVMMIAAIASMAVTTGCATKRYGRMQPLTGAEKVAYTCRELDLEVAKVQAFQQQVAEGAEFNMASVLGILGDYGIGNAMERSSAEKSAAIRLGQLRDAKSEKGCAVTTQLTPNEILSVNKAVAALAIRSTGGVSLRAAR